jgi:hypothetical protein
MLAKVSRLGKGRGLELHSLSSGENTVGVPLCLIQGVAFAGAIYVRLELCQHFRGQVLLAGHNARARPLGTTRIHFFRREPFAYLWEIKPDTDYQALKKLLPREFI